MARPVSGGTGGECWSTRNRNGAFRPSLSEQAAKALQSAESRMKGVERQVAAIEEKLRGSVEERRSHQLKLDDLRRALAAIRDSGAEHADVDELGSASIGWKPR